MNKIDYLIKELCPNGVKYSTLEQETKLNGFKQISANELENMNKGFGTVKLLPSSRNYSWFCDVTEENKNMICCGKVITVGRARHPNIKYCDGRFISSQNHIIQSKNENRLMTKFLYYFLSNCVQDFYNTDSSYPLFTKADYNRHRIPIPPLDVQKEIIRILDKFVELEVDLEAELETRKSQYEFWRGKLFDFGDEVEYKRLDELFPFIRNGFVGTVTPFFTEKENGIRYLQGTNIHNGIISDNEEYYVTKEFHEKNIKNELKSDDILMVQSGHIGECAVVGEKYKGCNCHALIIMSRSENVSSKFIVHYFHTIKGYNSLNPAITGGTIKHVLAGKIGKIKVPCPPLEVQERIVNILDRFDTLINDISVGLPAEIELRRQQYEYYRNKLLSFEELSVSEQYRFD